MQTSTDYDYLWKEFPDKMSVWERCVEEHKKLKAHNERMSSMINDLTLSLSMWIDGHPFDDDHQSKQRDMIYRACVMIGKPNTMEELAQMCGLDEELIELARQHDKELKQCHK